MINQAKIRKIARQINEVAKRGGIDVFEIKNANDVEIAVRFCHRFKETIRDYPKSEVMAAIEQAKKAGPRKFYRGIGLWLTAKEWGEGR